VAEALDRKAADQATSWGAFQVMGFNWSRDRYKDVDDLINAVQTEWGQLDAFARYMEADPALLAALRSGNWPVVETLYNGGGYGGVYAARLAAAAALHADGAMPPPRALRLGDKGNDVVVLQRRCASSPMATSGRQPTPRCAGYRPSVTWWSTVSSAA